MTDKSVWFVTGAGRGMGIDIAKAALAAGHAVVATGRNTEVVAKALRAADDLLIVKLDVTRPEDAKAAVAAGVERFGRIDVLVNNAGNFYAGFFEELPPEDFRAQIETNLFGPVNVTRAVLPIMRARRRGLVVTISSTGGISGQAFVSAYAAAKFGVEGFSESLSKEVAPLGIKVTIIEPGGFRTDFAGSSTELREGRPEYDATVGATVRFQRSYDGKQPGDPAKAAAALLHIASLSDPPLRLLLGSDSYNAAEQSALQKLELDRKWKDLSVSTDYSADGFSPQ